MVLEKETKDKIEDAVEETPETAPDTVEDEESKDEESKEEESKEEESKEEESKEDTEDKPTADEDGEKAKDDSNKETEENSEDKEDDDADREPKVELRVEIRHEDDKPEESPKVKTKDEDALLNLDPRDISEVTDPKILADIEFIKNTEPESKLEIALCEAFKRKETHIERLTGEITKLKTFISKRKQTYKRKRKDEGAPTRALSAYNIFVQDRFSRLAKENEQALKSTDTDAQLKRVPPASLVASTGHAWKELGQEEKVTYEVRAKADRKRYEEQMAQYQPPDKQANRKRNKTGYNMFFSAHVLRLKQSEMGVPSERGSVARLVGTAWKSLTMEEKQYYEREADKHNGMNPVEKEGEEEEDDDAKRQQAADPYGHMHPGHEMHMHGGMPPPMHPMHQTPQHDPRHHGYAYPPHHMYGQPPPGYDYYGHHAQSRQHQGRPQTYAHGYPPQPYDQRQMQM